MRLVIALLALSATSGGAAERVGFIHYEGRANLITEVRETDEAGRKVYIVTERPSGLTYRQDYAPDGTVWQKN